VCLDKGVMEADFVAPDDNEPEARCGHVAVTWNDSVFIWGGYRDVSLHPNISSCIFNSYLYWTFKGSKIF